MDWTDWPEIAVTAPLDPGVRLSALLLLLSTERHQPGQARPQGLYDSEVLNRLRRRRLPWTADTARLALLAVQGDRSFDGQRVGVALWGAEQVCRAGMANVALVNSLENLRHWLTTHNLGIWQMPEARSGVERVLSLVTPPDVMDLSLIRSGDAWGEPARAAASSVSAQDAAPLIRLLGELGQRKPSQTWRKGILAACASPNARDLLRVWLDLAASTDIVEPDENAQIGFAGAMLFAHGNDHLVRAAVLAVAELPEEEWAADQLGILARRGAATSGGSGMTGALALKVASAAVDALAIRDTSRDRAVLEELFEDLTRRDLVKRVGTYLGKGAKTAVRDEQLRRTKAADVRRKADPEPQELRRKLSALGRQHFAPLLRKHGFVGSGRNLRRYHNDRVDVVTLGSWNGTFSIEYGTRFDAGHPADVPWNVERTKLTEVGLDIRHAEQCGVSPTELERMQSRFEHVIVPFLDSLGRYELVLSYVEHSTGAPSESRRIAGHPCPSTDGWLGLLALSTGDKERAVTLLSSRVAFEQKRAAELPGQPHPVLDLYSAKLQEARHRDNRPNQL